MCTKTLRKERYEATNIGVVNMVRFLDVIRDGSPVVKVDADFYDVQQELHGMRNCCTVIPTLLVVLDRIAAKKTTFSF